MILTFDENEESGQNEVVVKNDENEKSSKHVATRQNAFFYFLNDNFKTCNGLAVARGIEKVM